jgi:hypothetical protein
VEGEDEGGLACYRSWKSVKWGFSQITARQNLEELVGKEILAEEGATFEAEAPAEVDAAPAVAEKELPAPSEEEASVEAESAPTAYEKEVRREEVLGAQNGQVKSKEPISAGLFRTTAGLDKFVKENATIKFEADLPESPQEDGEPEGEAEGSGVKRRAVEVASEAVEASTEDPEAPKPPTEVGREVDETKEPVGSATEGLKEKASGEAEVAELGFVALVEEDVAGFEVAVHDGAAENSLWR